MEAKYGAIEIVRYEDEEVEHTVKLDPPKSEKFACRTEAGILRNMDQDRFYTRLVEAQ